MNHQKLVCFAIDSSNYRRMKHKFLFMLYGRQLLSMIISSSCRIGVSELEFP